MHEPLVDAEGFPRNDIDVYQVRHARHEINCLQQDLSDLMKEIEAGLDDYHAEGMRFPSPKFPPGLNISNGSSSSQTPSVVRTPFVVINLVSPQSPAEEAVS